MQGRGATGGWNDDEFGVGVLEFLMTGNGGVRNLNEFDESDVSLASHSLSSPTVVIKGDLGGKKSGECGGGGSGIFGEARLFVKTNPDRVILSDSGLGGRRGATDDGICTI